MFKLNYDTAPLDGALECDILLRAKEKKREDKIQQTMQNSMNNYFQNRKKKDKTLNSFWLQISHAMERHIITTGGEKGAANLLN